MMTSGEAVKYKSSAHAFAEIVKKEGTKSLFKGAGIFTPFSFFQTGHVLTVFLQVLTFSVPLLVLVCWLDMTDSKSSFSERPTVAVVDKFCCSVFIHKKIKTMQKQQSFILCIIYCLFYLHFPFLFIFLLQLAHRCANRPNIWPTVRRSYFPARGPEPAKIWPEKQHSYFQTVVLTVLPGVAVIFFVCYHFIVYHCNNNIFFNYCWSYPHLQA